MKILYLLYSFTVGGTERLITDTCNCLCDSGNEIFLYIVNNHYDQALLSQLDSRVQVTLQNRPAGGGGKLSTLWKIARFIRTHRIEVVHCNSLYAPELLAVSSLMNPKTRVVYTIHGVNQYPHLGAGRVAYRNRLCHRFVAISESVARDLRNSGVPEEKIHLVYNAIDTIKFPPKSPRTTSSFTLGNVARIAPAEKGQDVLLRALVQLKDRYPGLRCRFAGGADAAHEKDFSMLRQLAADLGLEETVEFVGSIQDVAGFLQTVDVFVLPSRFEGFGISLVEAMAMGIPVVASDLNGPGEVLEQGKLGYLFPCEDSAALANTLTQVLDNYPQAFQSAQEQIFYVKEHYSIHRMCQQLMEIYR